MTKHFPLLAIIRKSIIPYLIFGVVIAIFIMAPFLVLSFFRLNEEKQQELTTTITSSITQYIDNADTSMRYLSTIDFMGIGKDLDSFIENFRYFDRLIVSDIKGKVIKSVPESTSFPDISNMLEISSLSTAFSSMFSFSFISPDTGKLTINTIHQLDNKGYLIGELNLDFLQEQIFKAAEKTSGNLIFVTDRFGNILIHPEKSLVEEQANWGSIPLLKQIREKKKDAAGVYSISGKYFLASGVNIPGVEWILVDAIELEKLILDIIKPLIIMITILVLLFAGLMLIISRALTLNIVHPLTFMFKILGQSVIEETPREIAELDQSFNELETVRKVFNMLINKIRENTGKLEQYQRAVKEAGYAIYITDAEGTINYVNPAFERITGFKAEEAIGQDPNILSSGRMPKSYFDNLWETISMGNLWDEQVINCRKDGSIYYANQTIAPITNEAGQVSSFVAIQNDVTFQRLAEQKLIESERKFRLLAENSTDMISRHDSEGNYLYASPACERLLGYSESDLIGKNAYDFFHPEDLKKIRESHEQIQHEDQGVSSVTYRIRKKDGSWIWFETLSQTVYIKDSSEDETDAYSVHEIMAISRDVTERIKMSTELASAKEEAEEANKAKSIFLANMSHEIRTPLNAVLGYNELIRSSIEEGTIKDYSTQIEKSGRVLLTLIGDILDFSKIEAGDMQLNYEYFDPRQFSDEIVSMFILEADKKGIKLKLDIDEGVPERIHLDEARVRQILLNLTGNAIKFTEEGAVNISLRADSLKYGHGSENGTCDFYMVVSDTGIGIPLGEQQRIFEAFLQKEGQSTRKYGGTGLGLAISKNLTEAMSGKILIDSLEDEGTTFTVIFEGIEYLNSSATQSPSTTIPLQHPKSVNENQSEDEEYSTNMQLSKSSKKRWHEVKASMVLDDIEEFALGLQKEGEQKGNKQIEQYARTLLDSVKELDLERLNQLFEKYKF